MKFLFTSFFISYFVTVFGQGNSVSSGEYEIVAKAALKLYYEKKYREAGSMYDSLFELMNGKGKPNDQYNAACSWALAGEKEKSFYHLYAALKGKWGYLDHINHDSDLAILHSDKRWNVILKKTKENDAERELKLNKPLIAALDTILQNDQRIRLVIDSMSKRFGWQSPEIHQLWGELHVIDSVNLVRVKKMLDTYGWLGPDVVGAIGSNTIFLVIQHADSLTQVTFLPLMREAAKKGDAQLSSLALLEDRILMRQGKEQIYGSQIVVDGNGGYKIYKIADEFNVNKRRAEMGLETLEEYAKRFGIEYRVPEK